MVDSSIGPYKIIREIAEDSVGQVFEAVDPTRNKRVAIKYVRPETASRPEIVPRLYAEAKTLALLNHPHIERLLGFVRRDDRLYLVMEFVEGETLEAVLKRNGRLQPNVALAFFHQIASAVGFAHRLGVIHGDLKPSNIMLTKLGMIKILDFATAPILGSPDPAGPRIGTVRYMSPEQIRGDPADVRSDIYSLGVLLYELIVGNVPYDSDSDEVILRAQTEARPLRASVLVPNSPKWIDAFLLRALAESRSNRFQSITAMAHAMEVQIKAPAASAAPKRRSVWRQRCAHWVSSVSDPILITRNLMFDSFTVFLASVMKMCRRLYALNSRAKRVAVETYNPTIWLKGASVWRMRCADCLSSVFNSTLTAGNRIFESLTAPFAGAMKIGRQKYNLDSRANRLVIETKNPMNGTKRVAIWRQRCAGWALSVSNSILTTRNRVFEPLKETLVRASEIGWKKYALVAFLLVSVTLESFFFGGANILLVPNYMLRPSTTLDDAVDSMLARVKQDPIISPSDNSKEPQAMVVKPINERPKAPKQQLTSPARSKNQPDASQWTTIDRARRSFVRSAAEKQTILATVKEPSVSEPIVSTRNAENNPAKTQLNIKWEN